MRPRRVVEAAAENAIRWWKERGEDPREKLVIFSDGLDVEMIEKLHAQGLSKIHEIYGLDVERLQQMGFGEKTASNLVRTLAERGYVIATKAAHDRGSVQLNILAPGPQLLKKAPGPFTGVLPEALARLDPTTLARLERDLSELLAVLATDERAANIPLGQVV